MKYGTFYKAGQLRRGIIKPLKDVCGVSIRWIIILWRSFSICSVQGSRRTYYQQIGELHTDNRGDLENSPVCGFLHSNVLKILFIICLANSVVVNII